MIKPLASHLRQFRFTAVLAILAITAPSVYSFGTDEELKGIVICSGNTQDDADAGIQALIVRADIISSAEGPDLEEDGEASELSAGATQLHHCIPAQAGSVHRKEISELPLFILFHCLKVFTVL
jgi:hypothetical protein